MEQSSRDGLSSETFLNPCPSFRPCAQSTPIKNSFEKLPVEEVFANSESEPDIFDESVDSVSKANTSHVSIEVFDSSFEAPGANASNSIEVFDLSSEDSNVPVDVESFESTQKSSKTITKVPEANASHLSIEVFDLSSEDIECEDAEKGCESSQNASSIRNSNDTDKEQNLETLQKSSNKEVRGDVDILRLLSVSCCPRKCTRKLSIEDISAYELNFINMDQTQRRNYMLSYLSDHSTVKGFGAYETEFIVKGKSVCRGAWFLIHNVNDEWYRRHFNKFKEGVIELEHGNKSQRKPSQRAKDAIAWLEFFVSCVGQYQPDNKKIHLPSCFSRLSIYQRMCEENQLYNAPSIGLSQFYFIFNEHFPHVLIPKENRFTKCTDCTRYKEAKEKTLDKKARREIDILLNEHMELVWRERRVYYLHRYKARRNPAKYLTIIDDAMDQKTTSIPRVRRKTKATCNLAALNTHLVGAIFHSGQSPNGKDVFGSFDFKQWPHDPNLNASVLLAMLVKWCERYQLPPVLYLQLDNCVKENKNQYILWLLALLVELKIFAKIRLNFLPVGHTHEDIDAFFGVFSKHLSQTDVYTVEDLLEAMESCLIIIKTFPFLLNMVYDIKEWLTPHAEELHSHTQPKCFKFLRDEEEHCVLYYRNYSHMKWEGPQRLLKQLPSDKPCLVQPTLDKVEIEALRRDLKKFEENYPAHVAKAWAQWVQDAEKILEVPVDWEWPLEVLEKCSKVKPATEDATVPCHLQALRDKETVETQQIYTGRYRPPQQRSNPVETVEDHLENIEVGKFVAVNLSNYDKVPVIGKVLQVSAEEVKVHYWKGSFKGRWNPDNVPRSQTPWVDDLPKTCVILSSFSLTEDRRLFPSTRKYLQEEYAKLRHQEH